MSARRPTQIHIRSYSVGFGDCSLISFDYRTKYGFAERHVLIDFGSAALPRGQRGGLDAVAKDIYARCSGRLHAVVATHAHVDHVSGFATAAKLIRACKPDIIVQPWTDALAPAKGPSGRTRSLGREARAMADLLRQTRAIAAAVLDGGDAERGHKTIREQIRFLATVNVYPEVAMKTLAAMPGQHVYVQRGSRTGLERLLPGVTVDVLGPPEPRRIFGDTEGQAHLTDEWSYWSNQTALALSIGRRGALFSRSRTAVHSRRSTDDLALAGQIDDVDQELKLQLLTDLDRAINNTSVILLFRIGGKGLLFPGDAQTEVWQRVLTSPGLKEALAEVRVYKAGHHGSEAGTPQALWGALARRGRKSSNDRLATIVSTMAGKHGSRAYDTEVPRASLISEFHSHSTLVTTQISGQLFQELVLTV